MKPIILAIFILFMVTAFPLLTVPELRQLFTRSTVAYVVLTGTFLISFISYFMIKYLDKDKISINPEKSDTPEVAITNKQSRIQKLAQDLEDLKTSIATNGMDSAELNGLIKNHLSDQYSNELRDYIDEQISTRIPKDQKRELLQQMIASQLRGVTSQINITARNASVNLAIGLTISFFGLIFLFYSISSFKPSYRSDINASYITQFLISILPRVTFTVLVEVFAFFFLNLYKNSHDQIKYYQNEKINIESKAIGLMTGISYNDLEIEAIVTPMMKVERNFILNKDESTVDLEKLKIDNKKDNDLLATMSKILAFKTKS